MIHHNLDPQGYPILAAGIVQTGTQDLTPHHDVTHYEQFVQPRPEAYIEPVQHLEREPSTIGNSLQATQLQPPAGRGRRPYQWLATWVRKIERVRQILPIDFDHSCEALQEAGGPSKSTTTNAVKEANDGRNPSVGLLKNRKGKARQLSLLEHEVQGLHQWHQNHQDRALSIQTSGSIPSTAAASHVPSISAAGSLVTPVLTPATGPNTGLEVDSSLGSGRSSKQRKRRRNEDDPAGVQRTGKHVRSAPPGTSSAQIDSVAWVEALAKRLPEVSKEAIDRVVHHMSATFSSDSTKSIKDFLSRHNSVRRSYTQAQQPVDSTLCKRLSPPFSKDGVRAIEHVLQLLEANASVHETNSEGETPLHLAVSLGFDKICGILLWAGADPKARTHAGKTVYDSAESALRACGKQKQDDNSLYSRILRCGQQVFFGLEGVENTRRSASNELLKVCNVLDTDEQRIAQREREHKERKSRSATGRNHKRHGPAEISLAGVTDRSSDEGPAMVTQSPGSVDSGFGGSPEGLHGGATAVKRSGEVLQPPTPSLAHHTAPPDHARAQPSGPSVSMAAQQALGTTMVPSLYFPLGHHGGQNGPFQDLSVSHEHSDMPLEATAWLRNKASTAGTADSMNFEQHMRDPPTHSFGPNLVPFSSHNERGFPPALAWTMLPTASSAASPHIPTQPNHYPHDALLASATPTQLAQSNIFTNLPSSHGTRRDRGASWMRDRLFAQPGTRSLRDAYPIPPTAPEPPPRALARVPTDVPGLVAHWESVRAQADSELHVLRALN